MNVKVLISESTLRAILDSHNGETIIGDAEQFYPCGGCDDRQSMIEFFISDIYNQYEKMSILISKIDSYYESLSAGEEIEGKKYVLAKKSIKFRKDGGDCL